MIGEYENLMNNWCISLEKEYLDELGDMNVSVVIVELKDVF